MQEGAQPKSNKQAGISATVRNDVQIKKKKRGKAERLKERDDEDGVFKESV